MGGVFLGGTEVCLYVPTWMFFAIHIVCVLYLNTYFWCASVVSMSFTALFWFNYFLVKPTHLQWIPTTQFLFGLQTIIPDSKVTTFPQLTT